MQSDKMNYLEDARFHPLDNIGNISLPDIFNCPFHYTPHPLCLSAYKEISEAIENNAEWKEDAQKGKMFGILIVRKNNSIGYLAAFSGILAGKSCYQYFVPPVYDLMSPDGFFKKGERKISEINRKISELEHSERLSDIRKAIEKARNTEKEEIKKAKDEIKKAKAERNRIRECSNDESVLQGLIAESQYQKAELKRLERKWKEHIDEMSKEEEHITNLINSLKEERKKRSSELQLEIFNSFIVLNGCGESKSLTDVFRDYNGSIPPAGSGECAAPKLLQYAFSHGYEPITMGEFWWGISPVKEIRKHGFFYPSCKSKCEPILDYMLRGLEVEENPLKKIRKTESDIMTVYEDQWIEIVNKPAGMLSVPGKVESEEDVTGSVLEWARKKYGEDKGPLLVNRLDMDTSGLIVIAKDKETHTLVQKLFEGRNIKKRYIAILNGVLENKKGTIELPLRVDLNDRPRQIVDFTNGKQAVTKYEVLSKKEGKTRIALYPITGRTHQLRVHAAHHNGLNTPILGDPLYGQQDKRLYLHAESIEFRHPVTGNIINVTNEAPF